MIVSDAGCARVAHNRKHVREFLTTQEVIRKPTGTHPWRVRYEFHTTPAGQDVAHRNKDRLPWRRWDRVILD